MNSEPMVTKTLADGEPALWFEMRFNAPARVLWKHLTEPDKLKYWFPCQLEISPRPGAVVTFKFPGQRAMEGTVLEAEKPRLLAYTWDEEVLRWEIEDDDDGGSLLTLTNTLSEGQDLARTAAGWHLTLMGLDDYLNERPLGQDPALWDEYVARYEDQLG
ncbi:SRPBCC domain-containing protein [Arthrobacter sp. 35/47]|uniref:SRPBCC domain-containing protein n=1 Tax=Arthrobacter sp. 35/47 TaxID=269454 RepID=UPI0012EBA39A|nr:SRPBCC domain-containing protein [Arthrobacter sp. 35/47]